MATTDNSATMAFRLSDGVKDNILNYFKKEHECVVQTRKYGKNHTCQVLPDTLKRVPVANGNDGFKWALDGEESARFEMKHYLCGLANSDRLSLDLPHELCPNHGTMDVTGQPKQTDVLEFAAGSRDQEVIVKLGIALREIDEIKESIRTFIQHHKDNDYYLWSVWDMELYKLQNAYTHFQKSVFHI